MSASPQAPGHDAGAGVPSTVDRAADPEPTSPFDALTLTVRAVRRLTDRAVEIAFEMPDEAVAYRPGQYLTLHAVHEGQPLARSYSLVTVPGLDDHLAVVVKRTDGGRMSNLLNDTAQAGQRLRALPPMGRFTVDVDPERLRQVVLLAAGSGITPIFGIARALLHHEPGTGITLIYANTRPADVIFLAELDALARRHASRFTIVHLLEDPEGLAEAQPGRLDSERAVALVQELVPDPSGAQYYVCGPTAFMAAAEQALTALDVPVENWHVERFTLAAGIGTPDGDPDELPRHSLTFVQQSTTVATSVDAGATVLEALEKAGVFLPSSCRVGDCGTCRSRLVSGSVTMANVDGLTEEEEADGYILPCVARATSDVDVVHP